MLNLQFKIFPVLTTKRLVMRRLVNNDAANLHQLRSDDEVNHYLDRPISTGIEDASAFIEKINHFINVKQSLYWVITLIGDDTLIGTICLWNFDLESSTMELGYELMPSHQGKGLMAEAVTCVINFGFNELKAKAITAFPSANNIRSVAVLKKLGFVIDDSFQSDIYPEADQMLPYFLKRPNS